LARSALEGRFQSAGGPSADGRPAPTGRCLLRRRRPTPGAVRLGRPISIGGRAFGRRSACADREGVFCVGGGRRPARSAWRGRFQSAGGPSADGRPVRRMNSAFEGLRPTVGLRRPKRISFASAEADVWRAAPGEADFNRRGGLRPTVGLCADRKGYPLRRRRPTLGAERPERPISIGGRAFGRRSACAPNEFGLRRPSANGRPTPTEKDILCVGGGRRLVRSARRGRFQSAGEPSADGRPVRRMNSAFEGLRPTVGLRRPKRISFASAEADAWCGAPGEADFNRREGLRPTVGLCAE
jgi:hypothetical protein